MTPSSRRLLRAVLVSSIAGALLSAVSVSSPATALVPSEPEVGDCHRLTPAEGVQETDDDPAVDCASTHQSRTFAVPHAPSRVSMDDNEALGRVVANRCDPEFERVVSRSERARVLSAYSYVWFKPTQSQIDSGARWLRCDVVLLGGFGFAPLPDARTPALGSAPHPDAEARCAMGARQDYRTTVCARSHQYRAKGTYRMAGTRYPGAQERFRQAERHCPGITGSQQWLVNYATRYDFFHGARLAVCSKRTTA